MAGDDVGDGGQDVHQRGVPDPLSLQHGAFSHRSEAPGLGLRHSPVQNRLHDLPIHHRPPGE